MWTTKRRLLKERAGQIRDLTDQLAAALSTAAQARADAERLLAAAARAAELHAEDKAERDILAIALASIDTCWQEAHPTKVRNNPDRVTVDSDYWKAIGDHLDARRSIFEKTLDTETEADA